MVASQGKGHHNMLCRFWIVQLREGLCLPATCPLVPRSGRRVALAQARRAGIMPGLVSQVYSQIEIVGSYICFR